MLGNSWNQESTRSRKLQPKQGLDQNQARQSGCEHVPLGCKIVRIRYCVKFTAMVGGRIKAGKYV